MKAKLIKYGLIALVMFLAYQQVKIYIDGIANSPLVSVFRYDPPLKKLREMKLKKGESVQAVQGTINVIVPKNVNAQQQVQEHPDKPFTIGRWEFDEACRKGGVIEVNWTPGTGDATLTYDAPPTRTFELGRLRELGLWVGLGWQSQGLKTQSVALEYRHDLLRIGPAWTALRAGIEWERVQSGTISMQSDTKAYVKLGVPLVRF